MVHCSSVLWRYAERGFWMCGFFMDHAGVVDSIVIIVSFLAIVSVLQIISDRWSSIPYTVWLIGAGLLAQVVLRFWGFEIGQVLSSDTIYFVLLPLLLFDSAYRITFHQFRLQFHTIMTLATVGLLISVGMVTLGLLVLTNLNWSTALLFGAIISSTDPIAVIALFKQLGAPRRLGLIADGESMLNDATSVIVFKAVIAITVGATAVSPSFLFGSVAQFALVFVGSVLFGGLFGLLASVLASRWRANLLALNLAIISIVLFLFLAAEHMLGLSGVVATVVFGLVYGNLAVPLFNHHHHAAFEHFWDFISLIAVSLVFFCASFSLAIGSLFESLRLWPATIIALLIARSVAVYLVCWFTNRLSFFRYEPNIPLSWQHVLNWGGLRGVIPLVLAYTLPMNLAERDLLISLTLVCFLFTLLINGVSIKPLLVALGLNRPQRVEQLYRHLNRLVELQERKQNLQRLESGAFRKGLFQEERERLRQEELAQLTLIGGEQDYNTILRGLRMAGSYAERRFTERLFHQGYMNPRVFAAFGAQLNQQLDRIEYPELPHRSFKKQLSFDISTSWRNRVANILGVSPGWRILFRVFGATRDSMIQERYALLQVRLMSSRHALRYFATLREALRDYSLVAKAIDEITLAHKGYVAKNRREMVLLQRGFPMIVRAGQAQVLRAALDDVDVARLMA